MSYIYQDYHQSKRNYNILNSIFKQFQFILFSPFGGKKHHSGSDLASMNRRPFELKAWVTEIDKYKIELYIIKENQNIGARFYCNQNWSQVQ